MNDKLYPVELTRLQLAMLVLMAGHACSEGYASKGTRVPDAAYNLYIKLRDTYFGVRGSDRNTYEEIRKEFGIIFSGNILVKGGSAPRTMTWTERVVRAVAAMTLGEKQQLTNALARASFDKDDSARAEAEALVVRTEKAMGWNTLA